MTTGSRSFGGASLYGSFSSKTWTGTDRPKRVAGPQAPFGFLLDDDGQAFNPQMASKEVVLRARVRRKAAIIAAGLVKPNKRLYLADHPYTCSWKSGLNGQLWFKNGSTVYRYPFLSMFGGFGWKDPWTSNDDLTLINKLRSRLQGSDFNAGIFIAEGNQALKMIADSALRIAASIRYAKKGNFREAIRAVSGHKRKPDLKGEKKQSAAGNWLQVQYGWRPLVTDMYNGAIFLADLLDNFPPTVVKVSRKVESLPTMPLIGVDGSASYGYSRKRIVAKLRSINQAKLVGLTDPASIVWEKLPYSFVADWALPIGAYLAARGVADSLTGTFITTFVSRYYGRPPAGTFQYDGLTWHGRDTYWETGGVMSRSVSSSLNIPLPSFQPLGKIASWQHCANALALLVQISAKRSGSASESNANHAIQY